MGLKIGTYRIHNDPVTGESGPQILLTNKTGGVTSKGYLVEMSTTTAMAFSTIAQGQPDIIGVIYEAGIADGSACWVWVVNAICEVYFIGDVSYEDFARNSEAGDGGAAGQAFAEVAPTSPFATDKHFMEIGHVVEERTGAGLCRTLLHFN